MKKDEESLFGLRETDALLPGLSQENLQAASGEIPDAPGLSHRRSLSLGIPSGRRRRGQHHRHRSSIGQMLSNGLEMIAEEMEQEAQIIKGTFARELTEADSGRTFFLDMSMTRSLSVLPEPEELLDFVDHAAGVELPREAPPEASLVARYASLLLAVLAVSSNGTALAMLHGVEPPLKLYWRMTATALLLSTFAARNLYKEGFPKISSGQWIIFAGAVFCFFLHSLVFITALQYTSIGNAVIGANSQALLLILGKFLTGEKVVLLEGVGVLLAFGGCTLCAGDEAKVVDKDENNSMALFGDALAFGSAAFGVGYLTFAKSVRSHFDVTVFMFLVMSCGSLLVLAYMALTGTRLTLDNDPFTGLFGWMTVQDNRFYIILHIAVICNICGTMGFVRAMQFFEPLVIAVATLLEPLTATLIAFCVGVGDLPGHLGWIGNALVIVGTLAVVYPSMDKPTEH